jgi:hypothetical protein
MQRSLFVPEHGYRQLCGHQEAFDHVVKPHGLRFDPAPMQEIIKQGMKKVEPGETAVISSEILSGHPFQGGYQSDVYAERLKRIVPSAKILVSIRNQMRILPSVYMQYVLRGGTLPPKGFFEGVREPGYTAFSPEHFEYDWLVAHYQGLFGADNVYVLTQESLKHNIAEATDRLAAFAGNFRFDGLVPAALKSVGESYPEHATPVLRRINHVQRSTLNPWPVISLGTTPMGLYKLAGFALKKPPLMNLLGGYKPATDYVSKRFANSYDRSNSRLAVIAAHPLNLSGYGRN